MTIPEESAESRVAEFLRQWAIPRDKTDDIYGILFDPECDELVHLYASDLHAVLSEVTRLRAMLPDPATHTHDGTRRDHTIPVRLGYRDEGI